MDELQRVLKRRKVVEEGIESQNRAALATMLRDIGDDKVQILGRVKTLDEALRMIGMTREEYEKSKSKEPSLNSSLLKYIKEQVMPDDFKVAREKTKTTRREFHRRADKRYEGEKRSRDQQFLSLIGMPKIPLNIEHMFSKNFMGNYSASKKEMLRSLAKKVSLQRQVYEPQVKQDEVNRAKEPIFGDINIRQNERDINAEMRLEETINYRNLLWDNPEDYPHEDLSLRKKAVGETAKEMQDELTQALEFTNSTMLPYCIEQFNRIQGQKLPKWYQAEEGETLATKVDRDERLVDINDLLNQGVVIPPTEEEVKSMEYLDVEKEMAEEGKKFTQDNFNSYELRDPTQIGKAIQRYEFLLNQSDSPVLSNFVHMLSHKSGFDMPNYEDLAQREGEKLEHKLSEMLETQLHQSEKMSNLVIELQRMCSVMVSMGKGLREVNKELALEVVGNSQALKRQAEERDERIAS